VRAKIKQVEGRAFLSGLATLKESGATLGAVSEKEGAAVKDAQAALDRAQSKEDYTAALILYRDALEAAKNSIQSTFQQEYAPVLPKVEAPTTRGVSGSWGGGETKVIAGARVTRLD
jgi:lambda repressor-like predicted transcriptional regulator